MRFISHFKRETPAELGKSIIKPKCSIKNAGRQVFPTFPHLKALKLYRFSLADSVAEAIEVRPKASAIESLP
jgi:hypothetical protein